MASNREERGVNNPINSAYSDTVADYGSSTTPTGDNVISDVTCDASVSVGDIVRMDGTTVIRAIATNYTNSKVIGICVEKSSSTVCSILTCGTSTNVLSGLSQANMYFLSDTVLGEVTSTPPTATGSYVIRIGQTQNGTNITLQIERVVKRT